jgi:hypothetical protein
MSEEGPSPEEQKPPPKPPAADPPEEPQSLADTEADLKEFFGSQGEPDARQPGRDGRPPRRN